MPKEQAAAKRVYQLKITLRDIRPPVWRRVLVSSETTLEQLHWMIQVAMGWTNSHLHQFHAGKQRYSDPEWELEGVRDESRVRLRQVAAAPKSRFYYEYDFGDSWEHEITVEKVLDADPAVKYPQCLTGKRAGPPEDCGGVWGYANLLEVLADHKHPEHKEMMEWVGGQLDPEHFEADEVNEEFRSLFTSGTLGR